jgi:hypothetical protein
MVVASLLFAGGCALAFGALTIAPRWAQVVVTGAGIVLGGTWIGHGVIQLDGGGLLAGLMLLALFWGLDALLVELRRPVTNSPSGQAPGGAHAPGEAGERDGERHAPILPGVGSTAGRAGRPRSFSEVSR